MALERREFVRRLRKARERKHFTQAQIAQEIGVGVKTYNRWEAVEGGHEPTGNNLRRLLDVLELDRDYLLGPLAGHTGRGMDARVRRLIEENNAMLQALVAHHGIVVPGLIDAALELGETETKSVEPRRRRQPRRKSQ